MALVRLERMPLTVLLVGVAGLENTARQAANQCLVTADAREIQGITTPIVATKAVLLEVVNARSLHEGAVEPNLQHTSGNYPKGSAQPPKSLSWRKRR